VRQTEKGDVRDDPSVGIALAGVQSMRTHVVLCAGLALASFVACSDGPQGGLDGEWGADPDTGTVKSDAGNGGGKDASLVTSGDAATGTDASAPVDAAIPKDSGSVDAANPCLNGVAPPNSGHHHPGADCMSCHDNLSNFKWTVAGTVYAAANSTTAVSGANVEIIDANNKKVVLATSTNGNFYTTTSFTFPVKVRASKCPADSKMTAAATTGSCNSNSCHTSGMRIHVP
jgi:hypothetical protein